MVNGYAVIHRVLREIERARKKHNRRATIESQADINNNRLSSR